jgi:N-carbamoylputrescine amidase
MSAKKITVSLIQQSCTASIQDNLCKTTELVRQASKQGAQLVVLQELHCSQYFCQKEDPAFFDLAESIPGDISCVLSALAMELKIVLVSSLFEKRAAGLYHNTAVVFDVDGRIAGKYRKMHIPDDPAYYEKFYFTPGDLGFEPIQTSLGKLGILICWDQWYPEAARIMALKGADLLVYPTAIGWHPADTEEEKQKQYDSWFTIQRAHAVANGLHVLSVNRVGREETRFMNETSTIDFWGASFVTDPQGAVLKKLSHETKDDILICEIDLNRTEQVRRMWPFLRDRRIDYYADLTKRFCD